MLMSGRQREKLETQIYQREMGEYLIKSLVNFLSIKDGELQIEKNNKNVSR